MEGVDVARLMVVIRMHLQEGIAVDMEEVVVVRLTVVISFVKMV